MDSCLSCGKSISEDDSPHSFGDMFCWKCDQVPNPSMDWKWDLYHPYDYLEEEYDERA